jgi:purine nucleoside phosphorylase
MSTAFGVIALEHINSRRRAINMALPPSPLPAKPPIQIIAFSSITNAGAGLSLEHPCHADVEKVAKKNAEKILQIYRILLKKP